MKSIKLYHIFLFQLKNDENLPDTCCRVCYSDLKYSSFVKKRINDAQNKLKDLLDVKDSSISFSVGLSDPFVNDEVERPSTNIGKTIKLEIVMNEGLDDDGPFDNDFDDGEMPEYKAELVEDSNILVLPKDEDSSIDKSDNQTFPPDCYVNMPTAEKQFKRKRGRP